MQILGKSLLLLGIALLGFRHAAGLRRRVACLRDFLRALERLERELSFALLPVDALLERSKLGSKGDCMRFFSLCEAHFSVRSEECLEEIWEESLYRAKLPLGDEDLLLLREIGAVLGRYDGENQRLAFGRIHGRLEEQLHDADEEAKRMGKVYCVLGVCIGLFLAILL